jgi:hypothetical protein
VLRGQFWARAQCRRMAVIGDAYSGPKRHRYSREPPGSPTRFRFDRSMVNIPQNAENPSVCVNETEIKLERR